ncbi:MAG: hypothetical protein R2759_06830 [Bacteroidales bacterium]
MIKPTNRAFRWLSLAAVYETSFTLPQSITSPWNLIMLMMLR